MSKRFPRSYFSDNLADQFLQRFGNTDWSSTPSHEWNQVVATSGLVFQVHRVWGGKHRYNVRCTVDCSNNLKLNFVGGDKPFVSTAVDDDHLKFAIERVRLKANEHHMLVHRRRTLQLVIDNLPELDRQVIGDWCEETGTPDDYESMTTDHIDGLFVFITPFVEAHHNLEPGEKI